MPKLTEDQKDAIRRQFDEGLKVKDILKINGIAKQTFYNLKRSWTTEDNSTEPPTDQGDEPTKPVRSVTFKVDPMDAGLDKLNPDEFPVDEVEQVPDYQAEPAYEGEQRYDQSLAPNLPNSYNPGQNLDPYNPQPDIGMEGIMSDFNLYDPLNMTNQIHEDRDKPKKPEKINVPKKMYDPKHVLQDQTKEEQRKDNEEKRQQCIYVIRSYVYGFKENLGLQSIIGKDDNAREKFVFQLFNKSLGELQKIESMVKYHVRTELSGTNQMSSSMLLVTCKVIETVGIRMNLRFEGLTNDIQQEIDNKGQLYSLLKEIEIEYNMTQYTSPKKELFFRLGLKLMEVDSKNRMIERQLLVGQSPVNVPNVPVDKLKHSKNEKLHEKYADL